VLPFKHGLPCIPRTLIAPSPPLDCSNVRTDIIYF